MDMGGKLQAELRKKRPFQSPEEEAFLNLQRTADVLLSEVAETLKPAGLSPTQYNVLRILRGAGGEGLACGEIAERMINRDPDVTRLLDRLEKRGLVARQRSREDRRVVRSVITPAALELLQGLDGVLAGLHRRQLEHLGPRQLDTLIELLELARRRRE